MKGTQLMKYIFSLSALLHAPCLLMTIQPPFNEFVTKQYQKFTITYPQYNEPTRENTIVTDDHQQKIPISAITRTKSSINIETCAGKLVIPTSEFSIQGPSFTPAQESKKNLPKTNSCKKIQKKACQELIEFIDHLPIG